MAMASASVKEFGKAWWAEVYNRIIGAVVFLDDVSAECLHWDGGLFNLLNGGAVAVKTLTPFEFCRKEDKKAVFITQSTWTQIQTVCDIIRHSEFAHVILISCVSFDVVYQEFCSGKDVNDKIAAGKGVSMGTKLIEDRLTECFNGKQCTVEVVHIPIFTISLTNVVFVTPPYQNVYPKFSGTVYTEGRQPELHHLQDEERNAARRLASGLNSMLDSMNLKEDIYYMGVYSTILAGILENSPVCLARRKNCLHPTSLIIVDRTLDVCGVTNHSTESVLDKIMTVLPRFPGHTTEVAVDMSPLCEANNIVLTTIEGNQLSPGCLYHATDECSIQTYDYMINKSQKEVMFDLYNKLSKIDVQKSPSPKTLLKVTPQSVDKIITASKGNYNIIGNHLGVLQQACAVVQTLKSPKRVQLELLTSIEKQFQQNLATSRDSTSVLQQMCQLIKTRKDRNLHMESLLALLVYLYSLKGKDINFSKQHEEELVKALATALYEDRREISENVSELTAAEDSKDISRLLVMDKLHGIANMRASLVNYNMLLKPCETGVGHEYKGLLQQLVDDMVDTERPEMYDLRYKGDSLVHKTKDLIRSGFNILTQKKKQPTKHPMDNSTIIIFVVGGITAEECKRLHRSVITSGIDNTVLIGSTKLVTPVEATKDVLDL